MGPVITDKAKHTDKVKKDGKGKHIVVKQEKQVEVLIGQQEKQAEVLVISDDEDDTTYCYRCETPPPTGECWACDTKDF